MTDAVAVRQSGNSVEGITTNAGFYSSLATNTRAEKMAYLKAVNNSENLKDAVKAAKDSLDLKVVDVVLQEVEIADEAGNISDNIRITLVTEDGTAYHATSKGIAQSLKQAFGVFGTPDSWQEPLEVTAIEEKGRNGYYFLTLKF
jgi:hypothetical protein